MAVGPCCAGRIAVIVVLITVAKCIRVLALVFGGADGGHWLPRAPKSIGDVPKRFADGFGTIAAGVGILVALRRHVRPNCSPIPAAPTRSSTPSSVSIGEKRAAVGAGVGRGRSSACPMFFEIGLVLLMPVIYVVARRFGGSSLITVGIPALAGLRRHARHSAAPPRTGRRQSNCSSADMGITLALGVGRGDSDRHGTSALSVRPAGRHAVSSSTSRRRVRCRRFLPATAERDPSTAAVDEGAAVATTETRHTADAGTAPAARLRHDDVLGVAARRADDGSKRSETVTTSSSTMRTTCCDSPSTPLGTPAGRPADRRRRRQLHAGLRGGSMADDQITTSSKRRGPGRTASS